MIKQLIFDVTFSILEKISKYCFNMFTLGNICSSAIHEKEILEQNVFFKY